MGNTPSMPSSIEAQGPPRRSTHKLSKPRTGNPATAGLVPNGFSNSSSRFSSSRMSSQALPLSPVVSSAPTREPPPVPLHGPEDTKESSNDKMATGPSVQQQKESRRRSLFRSLSSQRTSTSGQPPNRRNSSVGPSPRVTVGDKLARANSMTYEPTQTHIAYYAQPVPEHPRLSMGSRRTSWNYDMSSYEAKRLLNLVEEPTFEQTTTMSERMTVVSESTWKSSNPINTTQPADTPISRANSDLSLYTPVRRRSVIQTPGVATRTRASPAPSRHRAPSFRHSHPPTPSLSRQQSRESMRSGVVSMPPRILDPESMPRVVTPCEEEYQSIGAFKLGSLRITNGAASPGSPEVEKDSHMSVIQERTDYFVGTPAVERGETAESLGDRTHEIVSPQPRAPNLSPIAASFQETDAREQVTDLVVEETPEEYLAAIAFSHFSLDESAPLSPELQTTSKHTAMEDDLFEDDGNMEYSSVEVLDVRFDVNAKSQSGAQQNAQLTMRSVTRTDSGFVSAGTPSDELPPKTLTKADSGYSSNISLRSFHTSKSQVVEKEITHILEKQFSTSSSVQVIEHLPQTPTRASLERPAQPSRAPPPVPLKDHSPASPTTKSARPSIFTKGLSPGSSEARLSSPTPSKKFRHTPSPINSMRSSETGPKSSESGNGTPMSARSDTSTSALSIGSASNRPSKLQRLLSSATRRSAHGPLTAHATHSFDKTAIPSIPQEVETKLHEHTGMFPITSKRLALKPKASKDTLKTIFSVGSMEINLDGMNTAASTDDGMQDDDDSRARQLVHSVQSSIANAAAHIIPRKSMTRKPVPARQTTVEEKQVEAAHDVDSEVILPAEAELTSYNWINSSLGHNAYDAAVVAMGDTTTAQSSVQTTSGRTMSMTASVERSVYMSVNKRPSTSYQSDQQGIALPSPLLPRRESRETVMRKKTKTPPPVSMMTRSKGSLRVPPPLRHQSSGSSLSRKSSRESIHSYPSYQQAAPNGQSLSRKSSRENIHSYPSYQRPIREETSTSPPPIPSVDTRRSLSQRDRDRQSAAAFQIRAQNSAPQPDQALSRRSSMTSVDNARRSNSFSSAHSRQGFQLQRPSSTQPYQGHPNRPQQQLHHRASYDSFKSASSRSHPPSMSNGYTAPVKPRIDPRWNTQPGFPQKHQDPHGVYPPHVPRGHARNKSVGNRGYPVQAPYRILHSYNSPAYRNAPIWG